MISKNAKIYMAGRKGMMCSAIWRVLSENGYSSLFGRKSGELDLRDQELVQQFFNREQPGIVIDSAARVGRIQAFLSQ